MRKIKQIKKPWGSLPKRGESSYCLVLKGLDKKTHVKKYGRHRATRHSAIQTNLTVSCLRRYFLSRGLLRDAEQTNWALKPGTIISANPLVFYTVFSSKRRPFASFTDILEAELYANTLRDYCAEKNCYVMSISRRLNDK